MSSDGHAASGSNARLELSTLDQALSRISDLITEQQYYHIVEGLTNSDDFATRVAALSNLVSLEVSILATTATTAELAEWTKRFESCFTGVPIPQAESSELPTRYVYKIAIHGHDGIPAAIAMPADVERCMAQMITVQSMLCSRGLKTLHFELRQRLRKIGWLKDEWGHESTEDKAARERALRSAGSGPKGPPRS